MVCGWYIDSLQVAIDPVAFLGLAAGADPLTLAVPETHIEEAPVNSLTADVAAPSVVHIVSELALVDKVMAFSTEALHATIFVDLAEGALRVVLTHPQVVVDRAVGWRISDDIFSVQDSQLVPLLQALGKVLPVMQCRNQPRIVLRLGLELIHQFLGQVRSAVHDWPVRRRSVVGLLWLLFRQGWRNVRSVRCSLAIFLFL